MEFIDVGVGWSDERDSFSAGKIAAKKAFESIGEKRGVASLIFSSTQYDLKQMLEGAKSVIGSVPQIGATTKWGISNEGFHERSVVVSVIASDLLDFSTAASKDASVDPFKAGRKAVEEALGKIKTNPYSEVEDAKLIARYKPFIIFTITDTVTSTSGMHGGGVIDESILKGVCDLVDVGSSVVGGAAGEDGAYKFKETFQFCDWEVYSDSFVCGVMASKLKFGIGVRHGFRPVKGASALITRAEKRVIHELNGKPADEVYASISGLDLERLKEKRPVLGLYDPIGEFYWLKACFQVKGHSLVVNAPVKENACVNVMETNKGDQIKSTGDSLREALTNAGGERTPEKVAFVYIPNCTGRTNLLGEEASKQLTEVSKMVGKETAVVGFHTYGEHGAPRNSVCGFHNLTIPTLVIMDEPIYE